MMMMIIIIIIEEEEKKSCRKIFPSVSHSGINRLLVPGANNQNGHP